MGAEAPALQEDGPAVGRHPTGALHAERAGEGCVRREPPLGDVAVGGVDPGEGHLDEDLVLAGDGKVDLLHDQRLAVVVQAGGPGAGRTGRHGAILLI